MVSMNSFAQVTISEDDRKAIVQQVKKELLDSLNNNEKRNDILKNFAISLVSIKKC